MWPLSQCDATMWDAGCYRWLQANLTQDTILEFYNFILRFSITQEQMKKNTKKASVPIEFKKYFWDVDFDKLDLNTQKNFVLERLLDYAAFDSFYWIFKTFSNSEVKSLLDNKGKQSLSRNSYLFWGEIAKEKELWKRN